MAVTHEGTGGGAAESVGGAGDEDAGHEMILPPVVLASVSGGAIGPVGTRLA
jgi:hypothetical protein